MTQATHKYGQRMHDILDSALFDLRTWAEDNPEETEPRDAIFEIADISTPIYNSDILETISESPHLWNRESELGPAFDGTPTPMNIAAGILFEVIEEELWEEWRRIEEEREDA